MSSLKDPQIKQKCCDLSFKLELPWISPVVLVVRLAVSLELLFGTVPGLTHPAPHSLSNYPSAVPSPHPAPPTASPSAKGRGTSGKMAKSPPDPRSEGAAVSAGPDEACAGADVEADAQPFSVGYKVPGMTQL